MPAALGLAAAAWLFAAVSASGNVPAESEPSVGIFRRGVDFVVNTGPQGGLIVNGEHVVRQAPLRSLARSVAGCQAQIDGLTNTVDVLAAELAALRAEMATHSTRHHHPTASPATSDPTTLSPSNVPTSSEPTLVPTPTPTPSPSPGPTDAPTSSEPTKFPTSSPTEAPTCEQQDDYALDQCVTGKLFGFCDPDHDRYHADFARNCLFTCYGCTLAPTMMPTLVPTPSPTPPPTLSPTDSPTTSTPTPSPTPSPSLSPNPSTTLSPPTPSPPTLRFVEDNYSAKPVSTLYSGDLAINGVFPNTPSNYPRLTSVTNGHMFIDRNPALTSLGGAFPELRGIAQTLRISSNAALTSLGDGFPVLRETGGLNIYANEGLTTLGTAFRSLERVVGNFRFSGNPVLTNFEALRNLSCHNGIRGDISLYCVNCPEWLINKPGC